MFPLSQEGHMVSFRGGYLKDANKYLPDAGGPSPGATLKAITFGTIEEEPSIPQEESSGENTIKSNTAPSNSQISIHVNGQDAQAAEGGVAKAPKLYSKDALQFPSFMGRAPKNFLKTEEGDGNTMTYLSLLSSAIL